MNIALVCGNYFPSQMGGSMISTEALATRFSQNFPVDIICGNSQINNIKRTYRIKQLSSFPYLSFHPESIDYENRYAAACALEKYFYECSKYFKQYLYSVIDTQGPWCKSSTVVTVRFVYPEYLNALADFGYSIPEDDPWSAKLLELERRTYQSPSVKHFIAVSSKTKIELMHHHNISGELISVVNNGVDSNRFALSTTKKYRNKIRSELYIQDKDILITYCGNNYIRKNLRAFLDVVRHLYGNNIKLALIAKKDNQYNIITEEDYKHIVYFGMTPFPEKILSASDILLFPSIYDTCAKIVLESMAVGLPVVVSGTTGLSDILDHDKTGFIVNSPRNIPQFCQIVETLIRSKTLRNKIGKCASKLIASHYSWDQVSELVLSVYKKNIRK